jgi:transglutaminase-like putative cysteine protease
MGLHRLFVWNATALFFCLATLLRADPAPLTNAAALTNAAPPVTASDLTNSATPVATTNSIAPSTIIAPTNSAPPADAAAPADAAPPTPPAQIVTGPAPAWVKPLDPDAVTIPPATDVEDGVDYVLVDCQAQMEPMADFYHYTRRVVNEHGLADAGEIKGEFDPSYQTFTLHWLKVKRGGVWQDRMATDKFQLLQQEKNLDEQLLDGRYSAECHLQDLRVGDEIDYAYTVAGANPVFNGKYVSSFSTTWSSPVHQFLQRVITPPGRKLYYKSFTNPIQPTITPNPDGSLLLEWKASEVPAVFEEDNTPDWYDTYGWTQLSEFTSWKDVVDWGLGNYDFTAPLSPELQGEIDTIAKQTTVPEERALAAIQFVQDEIRYLGIEMGANSYKPTPAALACAHRFGDCKDKAFLCTVMLRALGIEAYPALVSTDYRQDTDKLLPSPLAFDHAIVEVIVDGRTYWIDVTRDSQRGKLRNLYIGDFKRALVLKPGNDALSSMDVSPESMPSESVVDTFQVKSVTDPAELEVHTTYTGLSAETTRSDFASSSIDKIQKDYLDYYSAKYPKIKAAKPVHYQDFPDDNRFEVWEDYTVPDLWSRKSPDTAWEASFSPHIVSDAIGTAPSPDRSYPYHVDYPSDVSENIEIHMFQDWTVDQTASDKTTPYFVYTDHPSCDKNVVHFNYRFKTLVPTVMPADITDYHDAIKKLQDNLGYDLTYTPPEPAAAPAPPPPFQPNWAVFGMVGMIVGASCYLAFRIYMMRLPYPPPPPPPDLAPYRGVRGWLILVGTGLVARTGIELKSLFTDYGMVWDLSKWNQFTVPGSENYDPLWAPILLFEVAFTILLPMLSILALTLMFQRRWVFPRIMIAIFLLTIAFKVIDSALASQIPFLVKLQTTPDTEMGQVFLQAFIWIPYMLYSKRVRATFRR